MDHQSPYLRYSICQALQSQPLSLPPPGPPLAALRWQGVLSPLTSVACSLPFAAVTRLSSGGGGGGTVTFIVILSVRGPYDDRDPYVRHRKERKS